ncbi:MAG: hypothetical protein LBE72_06220 [Rickettsia sp.]|nr:hypothetical protein [Rickettsia sp.]
MARVDTHQLIKNFIASGTSEKQAEIFINAATVIAENEINLLKKDHSNLATKNDLLELKSELKAEMKDIKIDLLKWIIPLFLTILISNLGILIALLK